LIFCCYRSGPGWRSAIHPKPRPEDQYLANMVNAGVVVIEREILDLIPPGQHLISHMTSFPRWSAIAGSGPIASAEYFRDFGTPDRLAAGYGMVQWSAFSDQHDRRIARFRGNREIELTAHLQHRLVLAQHLADEFTDAAHHPEVRELDINPLLADAVGVVALDARLRVAPAQTPGAARLAIAPYPQHLESTERLRDGTVLRMRPLRPEDEPMLHAAHMSHEDLRLRFFTPLYRSDPHGRGAALAARL
jgi:hypothetical protein